MPPIVLLGKKRELGIEIAILVLVLCMQMGLVLYLEPLRHNFMALITAKFS